MRWLTCRRGHHRWQIQAGIDLAEPVAPMSGLLLWLERSRIVVARSCPRCGTVEILE